MEKENDRDQNLEETRSEEESTEETEEQPTEEETEESDEDEGSEEESDDSDDPYANLDRDTAVERLRKAERAIAKNKKKANEEKKDGEAEKPQPSSDDATLARLENRGVMEAEDQEYVLKYAKVEGVSPIEALNEAVVQDKLSRNKKLREQQEATQAPSNRTGKASDDVDKWVRRYKKDGSLPDSPKLVTQVLDRLKAEDE